MMVMVMTKMMMTKMVMNKELSLCVFKIESGRKRAIRTWVRFLVLSLHISFAFLVPISKYQP